MPDRPYYVSVLEAICKGICQHQDEVRVEHQADEMGVKLTIFANPLDRGALIGRGGQTATAIRHIMRTVGSNFEARLGVIIYQEEPKPERRQNYNNAEMPKQTLEDLN